MFKKNINYEKIKPNTKFIGQSIAYFRVVDSTNTVAKNSLCQNGDIFIAETQTAGKGRMGREWVSEKNAGIWMSIALMPNADAEAINRITLVTGIAVCKTLRELYSLPFEIKWPNDIVIDGKKVCGILTEGVADATRVEKVIVGIGINVNNLSFDNHLKSKATSLYLLTGKKSDRTKIINRLAEVFEEYYLKFTSCTIKSVMDEYKLLCATLNKEVELTKNKEHIKAFAYDVTDNGELVVKKEDGTTLTVNSGEVSVYGYY